MESTMWENVDSTQGGFTERMSVPGGWLVRVYIRDLNGAVSVAITFYPDHTHEWKVKEVK